MKHDGTRHTLDDIRAMNTATISNTLAAEVLGMNPARLAQYAKDGVLKWEWMPSGNRVKHARESFIRFWGGSRYEAVQSNENNDGPEVSGPDERAGSY